MTTQITASLNEDELDGLLNQYARRLRTALDEGTYRDDDEDDLANYTLGALFARSDGDRYAGDENNALAHLVTEKLATELVGSLLDEDDPRSEQFVQDTAARLRLTIADQNNKHGAIHYLVKDAIVERAEVLRLTRPGAQV